MRSETGSIAGSSTKIFGRRLINVLFIIFQG
jgi:hypothetical protein